MTTGTVEWTVNANSVVLWIGFLFPFFQDCYCDSLTPVIEKMGNSPEGILFATVPVKTLTATLLLVKEQNVMKKCESTSRQCSQWFVSMHGASSCCGSALWFADGKSCWT